MYTAEGGPQTRRLSTHIFSQAVAPSRKQLAQPRLSDQSFEQRIDMFPERRIAAPDLQRRLHHD